MANFSLHIIDFYSQLVLAHAAEDDEFTNFFFFLFFSVTLVNLIPKSRLLLQTKI